MFGAVDDDDDDVCLAGRGGRGIWGQRAMLYARCCVCGGGKATPRSPTPEEVRASCPLTSLPALTFLMVKQVLNSSVSSSVHDRMEIGHFCKCSATWLLLTFALLLPIVAKAGAVRG